MKNNSEQMNVTKVVDFVKREGHWYINLPEFLEKGLGERDSLKMVDGADTFLDIITQGSNRVSILINTDEFGGYDAMLKREPLKENKAVNNPAAQNGAHYLIDTLNGKPFNHRLWFGAALEYLLLGNFPERVYLKTLNISTMKKRKTIYHLLVDKSGSMCDCIENTLEGMNEQVNKIKDLQEKYPDEELTFGLTTFNTNVTDEFTLSDPKVVPEFRTRKYKPNGCTALLDAIGVTVAKLETFMQQAELRIPTTVVLIIITDGYENASKLFKIEDIKSTIARLEQTDKWTFSFLGADIDAVDVATDLSINIKNSYNFNKGEMKTQVWHNLNESRHTYVDNKSKNVYNKNYFKED